MRSERIPNTRRICLVYSNNHLNIAVAVQGLFSDLFCQRPVALRGSM